MDAMYINTHPLCSYGAINSPYPNVFLTNFKDNIF